MASPFPVNATLVFEVSTGETETDELGNTRAKLESLTVLAYLKEKRSSSSSNGLDSDLDSDRHAVTVEGRCIDPAALPPSVVPGSKAIATIGDLQGEFELSPTVQTAFEAVTAALGAKIKGTFTARVLWGQADV